MSEKPSRKELLNYINDLKSSIKDSDVFSDMCKQWDCDTSVLDIIPISFADLDVSARTDHGIIYLSYRILDSKNTPDIDNDHYLIHEISHYFQQCYRDKPTKGSNAEDYLDNEFEQEAFQNQTEFITDEYSQQDAVDYINRVLDKHEVKGPERKEKAEILLNIAHMRARRINGMR